MMTWRTKLAWEISPLEDVSTEEFMTNCEAGDLWEMTFPSGTKNFIYIESLDYMRDDKQQVRKVMVEGLVHSDLNSLLYSLNVGAHNTYFFGKDTDEGESFTLLHRDYDYKAEIKRMIDESMDEPTGQPPSLMERFRRLFTWRLAFQWEVAPEEARFRTPFDVSIIVADFEAGTYWVDGPASHFTQDRRAFMRFFPDLGGWKFRVPQDEDDAWKPMSSELSEAFTKAFVKQYGYRPEDAQ